MEIEELYDELREKLSEWDGEYYLHASEGRSGIKIGGSKNDYPQEVGIEITEDGDLEPETIEIRLRQLIEGTEWALYDDGFFTHGYSPSTCEIFISREIEHPSLFEEEFKREQKHL